MEPCGTMKTSGKHLIGTKVPEVLGEMLKPGCPPQAFAIRLWNSGGQENTVWSRLENYGDVEALPPTAVVPKTHRAGGRGKESPSGWQERCGRPPGCERHSGGLSSAYSVRREECYSSSTQLGILGAFL